MIKGIGIDFGTTNSSVAVAQDDGTSEILQFRTEAGTTETYRSVLYFEPKMPGVSGPKAIERYLAVDEKGRLIQSLKSFLASRTFTGTSIYGRQFSVEDLITIMLRDLRTQAEEQIGAFGGPIVVGRPVHYSNADTEEDNQFALDRLKRALEKAGVGPVIFEYEPVAAAYFYESTLDHDELIMIGDFGGGTSDFSLLRVGPGARRDNAHRIFGTEGVSLAGDAFDARVVRNLISLKLGRTSEYRSLDKVLPMPEWVYSDLERWHYLSFLKSNDTIQMLRSIQAQSFEPEKIGALLHIIQNDLGFYLHRSVQQMRPSFPPTSSDRLSLRIMSSRCADASSGRLSKVGSKKICKGSAAASTGYWEKRLLEAVKSTGFFLQVDHLWCPRSERFFSRDLARRRLRVEVNSLL